jgi:hypothetical protein
MPRTAALRRAPSLGCHVRAGAGQRQLESPGWSRRASLAMLGLCACLDAHTVAISPCPVPPASLQSPPLRPPFPSSGVCSTSQPGVANPSGARAGVGGSARRLSGHSLWPAARPAGGGAARGAPPPAAAAAAADGGGHPGGRWAGPGLRRSRAAGSLARPQAGTPHRGVGGRLGGPAGDGGGVGGRGSEPYAGAGVLRSALERPLQRA